MPTAITTRFFEIAELSIDESLSSFPTSINASNSFFAALSLTHILTSVHDEVIFKLREVTPDSTQKLYGSYVGKKRYHGENDVNVYYQVSHSANYEEVDN